MAFLSRIKGFFRTPLYKSTGSIARDHLASERTFLAWIRTGIGFIALGIAIERFSQLDLPELVKQIKAANQPASGTSGSVDDRQNHHARDERILVSTLLSAGLGSIVYGSARYFSNLRLLEQGYFRPALNGPAVLGVGVASVSSVVFWSMAKRERERSMEEK